MKKQQTAKNDMRPYRIGLKFLTILELMLLLAILGIAATWLFAVILK
jgi:hypothetical protein